MIIKNKRTKKIMYLSYDDFHVVFAKEIIDAFESYKKTFLAKPYFYYNTNHLESDFKFNLQWNFNNHSNSNWYIESM